MDMKEIQRTRSDEKSEFSSGTDGVDTCLILNTPSKKAEEKQVLYLELKLIPVVKTKFQMSQIFS